MNEDVLSESGLRTPHSVYRSGVLLLPPLSVFLFVFAFAFVCLDGGASQCIRIRIRIRIQLLPLGNSKCTSRSPLKWKALSSHFAGVGHRLRIPSCLCRSG